MSHYNLDYILYGYLIVCVSLVFFNIFYIFYSAFSKRRIEEEAKKWVPLIKVELTHISNDEEVSSEHLRRIEKKTNTTGGLLAYSRALDRIKDDKYSILLKLYYWQCAMEYQKLAEQYDNKSTMERAFMAYFLSAHSPCFHEEYRPVYDIVIGYAKKSSVYCRENILKALYAFGNVEAVYRMLFNLDEFGVRHHKKLLSDGLMTFRGDKKALADYLWTHRQNLSENTNLAVINFIIASQDGYSRIFFDEIERDDISLEIRLACLRYFRRHYYEPIIPVLYRYMEGHEDPNISIIVASVLSNYPSQETRDVLKNALKNRNWYIRMNSAASLVAMAVDKEDVDAIKQDGDRYAIQMLSYMIEKKEEVPFA